MARKDAQKALTAFITKYGNSKQITRTKLGKSGGIVVTLNNRIDLPSKIHGVSITTVFKA